MLIIILLACSSLLPPLIDPSPSTSSVESGLDIKITMADDSGERTGWDRHRVSSALDEIVGQCVVRGIADDRQINYIRVGIHGWTK